MTRLLLAALLLVAACSGGQASDEDYVKVSDLCEIVFLIHSDISHVGNRTDYIGYEYAPDGGVSYDRQVIAHGSASPPSLDGRSELLADMCGEQWDDMRYPPSLQ